MSHSGWKSSNKAKSVYSNNPVNRHRLLGWANETLSKLKSDKHFLSTAAKKNKGEDGIANADCRMTRCKKGKRVEEELSKLKTNDVTTYVSEIVTSKMERKIHHMAFDSSVTGDNQKKKASKKESLANTESKKNGDSQYKLKSKHRHTVVSCIEDKEGDLYQREESTERKKKKKKYKESSHEDCSADTTRSEVPLTAWLPVGKERSRKKQKLTEHSKSDRVDYYHCYKCASKEVKTQKKEMNTNDHTNMSDGMKYLSDSGKVKKCKMNCDVYTGRKTESAFFWEGAESTDHYKQGKKKRSKHAYESMLEDGEQLSNERVTKESSKEKKKEKRCCTHSFSEQSTSKKKKMKKYKLCTQEHMCDESRSASEHVCRMDAGVRCDLPPATEENKSFEVHYDSGKKSKKRKHRHDCWFSDKLEGTKTETHNSCNTECALEISEQETNKEDSCCYTVEERKRKKRGKKRDICSESEIISEAKDHDDLGPGKKKKRKKDKQNCKDNENISNSEERDKQKLYSDGNNGNTVETSFMEEKQKKKQKKSKHKVYNVSVDAKEGNEEYRHKKDASVGEIQMTNENVDHALLDYKSTNAIYSVKRKDKTGNKRKSETEVIESVNSKKNKGLSAIPKETQRVTAATTHEVGYTELNLAAELTQTVNSLKDKSNDKVVLTSIIVDTNKNALHSRNIKQGRSIGNFGLSPIAMLLGTELEFSDSNHSCSTCCRCKLHRKIRPLESSESPAKEIGNIVIKTEPGLITEQEKKIVDDIDQHIMDKRMLDVIPNSQIELNPNAVNETDEGMKTTENSDAFIDKLGMQEHITTESGNGPNESLTMNMHVGGTDNDLGSVGCVEGFNDEDVVSGDEEIDINTPFYNIYDDKITVKEEILHLTNTHDDQNDGWNHAEDTSQDNFKFLGNQDMTYMGNKIEPPSGTLLDDTAVDVDRILKVEDVNGSDLNTVLQYEPTPFNEIQSKCDLNVVPEVADLQNLTWNARETVSLCWPPANGNQHQSSQLLDATAFTSGQVCFSHVPKWWRRGRIAQTLSVPITAVYIHFNYYNRRVRKNYVTVNFFDNQSLQNVMSNASRVHCSEWSVRSKCSE